MLLQTRYGTVTACQARLTESCTTALAARSTGNSPDRVAACARAYSTWSCADYLGDVQVPAACAEPHGALATGTACAFAAQCVTGFCAIQSGSACGSCAPPPAAADSCSNLTSCGQGLLCLPGSHVCGALGASGAACGKDAPCGAHLSCTGASDARGTAGTCQASAALAGSPCDPMLVTGPGCDYEAGLTCNSRSKRCEALVISGAGGPCDLDNHQFAVCAAGGTCSTSEAGALGSCTSAAADGQACATTAQGPACLAPARCITTSPGSTSGLCQEDNASTCR